MIELSSEARRAYEVMVTSLEQTDHAEAELAENTEEQLQISSLAEEAELSPDATQPEEPEYSKLLSWAKGCVTCSLRPIAVILSLYELILFYKRCGVGGWYHRFHRRKSNKTQIIILLFFFF